MDESRRNEFSAKEDGRKLEGSEYGKRVLEADDVKRKWHGACDEYKNAIDRIPMHQAKTVEPSSDAEDPRHAEQRGEHIQCIPQGTRQSQASQISSEQMEDEKQACDQQEIDCELDGSERRDRPRGFMRCSRLRRFLCIGCLGCGLGRLCFGWKKQRWKLEDEKERERFQGIGELERIRTKTAGKDDEKVRPKAPAGQSGVSQAAIESSGPEDAEQNYAVSHSRKKTMTIRMGVQHFASNAAQNHHRKGR